MRFKSGEKQVYKEVNKATTTRFPIKVDLALAAHKVSLIIQAVLGGTATPLQEAKHRFQFNLDQGVIFQHARRLIRCVVDCQAEEKDSVATRNALMLVRSLGAKIWDDSPLHLEQLTGIGPAAARRLINANISSIAELAATEPHRIEMALSKQAPFGLNLVKQASTFPQLRLKIGTSGPPVSTSPVTRLTTADAFRLSSLDSTPLCQLRSTSALSMRKFPSPSKSKQSMSVCSLKALTDVCCILVASGMLQVVLP